jgi:hypothetical protein
MFVDRDPEVIAAYDGSDAPQRDAAIIAASKGAGGSEGK